MILQANKNTSTQTVLKRQARLMVLPAITLLLAVGIFPLFYSIYLTFHKWILTRKGGPRYVKFDNFEKLFEDERFFTSLKRTVSFTVQTVGIEFLVGLLIALLLSTYGLRILRSMVLLPMIIAPTVAGLIWRFMFNDEIGVINFLLGTVGINGPLWLGDPDIALYSLILVDLWQWTPFVILILLAGLLSLPTDIEEAAAVDGANSWQMVLFIKLPLIRAAMFVAIVFRAIDAFRTFDTIWVLTAGGPNNVTEFLSIYTYKVSLRFFELSYGALLSFVLLVIILITSRLLFLVIKRN